MQAELTPDLLQRLAVTIPHSKALNLASRHRLFSNNSKHQQVHFSFMQKWHVDSSTPRWGPSLPGHCLDFHRIEGWIFSDPARWLLGKKIAKCLYLTRRLLGGTRISGDSTTVTPSGVTHRRD